MGGMGGRRPSRESSSESSRSRSKSSSSGLGLIILRRILISARPISPLPCRERLRHLWIRFLLGLCDRNIFHSFESHDLTLNWFPPNNAELTESDAAKHILRRSSSSGISNCEHSLIFFSSGQVVYTFNWHQLSSAWTKSSLQNTMRCQRRLPTTPLYFAWQLSPRLYHNFTKKGQWFDCANRLIETSWI